MTIRVDEAILVIPISENDQQTIINDGEGATTIVKGMVAHRHNSAGRTVAFIGSGDIAQNARGEGFLDGVFNITKRAGNTFENGDDVYWSRGHNEAIYRSQAKAGDFWVGKCNRYAATTDSFVDVLLFKDKQPESLSVSLSISSTSVSDSSTSSQSSDSSASHSSQSHSSDSDSSSSTSIAST